jgi:hypothetical protein
MSAGSWREDARFWRGERISMHLLPIFHGLLIVTASFALSGCATLTQAASPDPASGPAAATVTIGTDGIVSPKAVTIMRGQVVAFVNKDSAAHTMFSDPHPVHTDCRAMNAVGELKPGESRNTGSFDEARECGFHDHQNPENPNLLGLVRIQ